MKTNKNIIFLSLAFFIIFLGFNGVQQYVTSFFDQANLIHIGFNSLIIIYLSVALFSPIASIIASNYGPKKSLIIATPVYILFILSLLSKNSIAIYLSSAILGIAAAILWTGQGAYLIRASEGQNFGKNAGIFTTLFFLGSSVGIFILGFLIKKISFTKSFVIFSSLPLVGLIILLKLTNYKSSNVPKNKFKLVKKAIKNITALKLSTIWFSQSFVYGLSLGLIPLTTKQTLGIEYIAYLLPAFYIAPIFLSYIIGKKSDESGLGKTIFISYFAAGCGLISLFTTTKIGLIIGVLLLAFSFASLRVVTLALPGNISSDTNLEFLNGLFWLVQSSGTVIALFLSKTIQTNVAYLVSFTILIISLIIIITAFKSNFSKQSFQNIKQVLSEQIK